MLERWKVLESTVEPLAGPFALRRERASLPSRGITHDFILLDSPDWVNVVAVTEAGRLVMVRQHRLGSNRIELEIPGGLVDPEDGNALEAAQRELLEETGYRAPEWFPIGTVAPNPALQSNLCHTFLARGCWRAGEPQPDAAESLEVVEIPVADLAALIEAGEITHGLVLNALFWHYLWEDRSSV